MKKRKLKKRIKALEARVAYLETANWQGFPVVTYHPDTTAKKPDPWIYFTNQTPVANVKYYD